MKTAAFLDVLGAIAPLQLAEDWDNVGVIVAPLDKPEVERVLLTVDLTQAVLREAIEASVDAIIAYHPPIFSGLKRIAPGNRSAELALGALAQGILIYSPHTALDAALGGLNDWLCESLGPNEAVAVERRGALVDQPDNLRIGQGRLCTLHTARRLDDLLCDIKAHLDIKHVRLATPVQGVTRIATVGLCAGAGGSVLEHVEADLLLTGEMRHHDVLAKVEQGTTVVLTEHTNTERGYLPRLAKCLREQGLICRVSEQDSDPLIMA